MMIKQIKMGLISVVGVVLLSLIPGVAHAIKAHVSVNCDACHRTSISPRAMGNVCVGCHSTNGTTAAKFFTAAASNTLGHNPMPGSDPGKDTSHNWGGFSTTQVAAGSTNPTTTFYTSRYSVSKNRVTCTICHDPHGEAGTKLVRAVTNGDLICQQCHGSWFVFNDSNDVNPLNDTNALLTHPVVTNYTTFAATKPNDYRATVLNSGNGGVGDVRLVNGGVYCSSCHGTHYTDSSSATVDGTATFNAGTMAVGDGNILRSDGPLRTGATRNTPKGADNIRGTGDDGAPGTAQLRSNLCQSCHTIELHGQGNSGDHTIGCLDCHGGHAYNGGTPNAYILNKMTPDAVPTRINGSNSAAAQITFPNYPNGGSTRTKWADDVLGTATGLCEQCHGDTNSAAMVTKAAEHEAGNNNECNACHKHNDPANLYSFNRDASAATCGQCHGFPPYLNSRGDQGNDPDGAGGNPPLGTLGGYAWNYVDVPAYDYVNSTSHEKDETITGHKVHAGADLPTSPAGANSWYFVGVSGVDNCKVCHGPDAGATAGGHRIAPGTRPDTFRDLPFDGIAKTGGMNPVYQLNTPWTCSAVYCHTNGAPYDGNSRPNRVYSFVNTTPSWIGNGVDYASGGYGSIHGKGYQCAACHGNTAATMASTPGNKYNSAAHLAHLGGATTLNMGKTFSCSVCHVTSAASATAMVANAMDGRLGGKHVNGLIDVAFETGSTPDTLPEALTGSTFTVSSGVCATYCHNVAGTGGAFAADWDVATDMQCDSCHGGLASDSSGNGGYGAITTGSHGRHIITSGNGPKLLCAECHGTGSDAGTHAGHFDGLVNMKVAVNTVSFGSDSVSICKECHGYDVEAGEVLPAWGNPVTTDCATCHAGNECGTNFNSMSPPVFNYARSTGHNRTTGNYPVSANVPANSNCLDCHAADSAGHWNGILGDASMLRTDIGFPATYAGNENAFCGNCHGTAPAHPTKSASVATRSINTHQSKLCAACHNVHGTSNIQMIIASRTEQNNRDDSGTGAYGGFVTFTGLTGVNSYDEDDGAVGGAGELNANDLCATCHSVAGGTNHNNLEGTGVTHYQGENCMTCHASHADATDAFRLGAGTACNDCHGFPPATGAHRKGILITDPELHSNTTGNLDTEDRSDCAFCHTGANLYTYDLGADQLAGGARGNHAKSQTVRRAVLTAAVGYEATNFSCTTACHASTNGDGEWDDVNGLNCNACHYAAAAPTSAGNVTGGNSEAVSAVHNKHFDKNNMTCAQCHDVSYSAGITAVRGVLTHVIAPDYSGAGNDGTLVQGRANAILDEATVTRSGMTYSAGVADAGGANNACSGGITTGCHASGSPDWDVVIPATSAGCVMCHTETNTAAYNPTSGVHDNSPSGPTVTGNAHDGNFDNGSAGTADCVTCHTASPNTTPANHVNGLMNTGAAITVSASVGYTVGTADCATTCHSAGTSWRYKWSTSAYNTNGTECANCHGDYATGWLTGVAPHTEVATKGNKHNNVGNLTYPCTDCHAIGSAGYNWTSKWNPNAASSHGDDKITMNQVAGTNTFTIDTAPTPDRAGCVNPSCHNPSNLTGDTDHTFRITTTSFTTQTVTGPAPAVLCSGCHGGYAPGGTTVLGYWPDGGLLTANTLGSEDEQGAHVKHMTVLAQSKYGENLTQLLTDNGNGTGDVKQKFLCAYCHGTASGNPIDATHGLTSYLPADVTRTYAQWDLTQTTAESGVFTTASDTCATVDCHFNKTTPTAPTNFSWYGGATGACIMCHVDITNGAVPNSNGGTHVAHTSAATNFGRTVTCDDCHKTASETVAWGSPGTPPTNNHINGALTVTGSVAFTYSAGSCGTNNCHEDGKGAAPKTNPYPWGMALANCTICHDASPTTDAHTKHLAAKVTSYMPGSCGACHANSTTTQITAGTHIDNISNAGGGTSQISAAPGNGSCTNTCHLSPDAGDWAGGAAAIGCVDCHSGSGASAYIGGDKTTVPGPNYMPQYNLHSLATSNLITVTGIVHDQTVPGAGGSCAFCHSTMAAQATTHPNGVWTADDADNTNDQNRGMFAAFTDGSPATCATTCHTAGTSWRYKWSATASSTGGSQCDNCHGVYGTWTTGTAHATNATRGNGAHTDSGNAGFPCTDCHSLGSSNGAYPYTVTSNDWKPTELGTTLHGDNKINMNSTGTTWARNGGGLSGCSNGCHANGYDATHQFPESTTAILTQVVAGVAPNVSAGCTTCHGGAEYAPDGVAYPDRTGKHPQHVAAIAMKLGGNNAANRNAACDYCHLNPGESGHNTNNVPLNAADVAGIKRITNKSVDTSYSLNGQGTNYVTCTNVDCHFEQPVTPHWYTDDVAPAAVPTLTAVAGPNPRSIKVSWVAPGDDTNVADTTAYVYDLRMGATSGAANTFDLSPTAPNYAGNLPAVYKQGSASEAIIENLTAGATYWFSLKTKDNVGNWSASTTTSSGISPTVDNVAPIFGGADKATKADRGQTVYLYWTPAEDHTMPITYKVWYKAESAGAIDFGVAPNLTGVKGHNIQIEGLTNDEIYHFGVRACDANNFCDLNTDTVSATPTADPTVAKTNALYRANGTAASTYVAMEKGAAFTLASTSALPVTFRPGANLGYDVRYFVDGFRTYITNGNGASVIRATLGTSTGANFIAFTAPAMTADVSMGARAKGIKSFKFGDLSGRVVPSGSRIAVQLTLVSGAVTSVGWGSAANDGSLTTAEQIVNLPPSNPNVGATVLGANVNITWTASTDTADGVTTDVVHYDLFGSDDNGSTYRFLIASGLTAATTNYSWNTQEDGIAGAATVAVKLLPGDGFTHYTAAGTTVTGLAINNTNDNVAPSAINDLVAKARPKSGSVELTWTAPGDDDYNNGRAKYYDIRYSTAVINEGNFAAASQAVNEPSPLFGGQIQNFEVTGLTPGTTYYFAIKTYDDGTPAKVSPISTAKSVGSDQANGGPRCGMCHTTAPSIVESVGNHKLHGFTIKDCTNCHGAVVSTYDLDHQDGIMKMGYGPGGPQAPIIAGNRVYYTNNGLAMGSGGDFVMYDDIDGFGGFGNGSYTNVGDGTDDGTCLSFGAMGVGGCHGSAGTDPDGGGSLPTYATPNWTAAASLDCAACHGNPNRTVDSFYSRAFDAGVTAQIKGSPVVDNRGNFNLTDPDEKDRKYIGQHEKHLNYSFRFAKGDSCNLCHSGNYSDVNNLDGKHGNGDVDIKLDKIGAGPNATWTAGTATTAGSCSNMSADTCHPALPGNPTGTVKWDSNVNFDCVSCHGFNGVTPSHVTDPNGGVSAANSGWATDLMAGNCTYCHFGGHPQGNVGGTALVLTNSSQVGINYKSGGIHMKQVIGGRSNMNDASLIDTEAELCWGCHEDNSISEWGDDTGADNTVIRPPNSNNYNFGTLSKTSWIGATWTSGNASFGYKTAAIKSTHATSSTGSAVLTSSDRFRTHTETVDAVGALRCSNCHDVHNMNKAPGDNTTGKPYLRGSWLSNPYLEDGAPRSGMTFTSQNLYGQVPRGGSAYVQSGGYFIDQNSGNPTAGYSVATSAGLCTLCHGTDIDGMDKVTGESLWLGTNGHSNSAIGGTGLNKINIFDTGTGTAGQFGAYSGRPTALAQTAQKAGESYVNQVPDMGYQIQFATKDGYGYRGTEGGYTGGYTPNTNPAGRSQANQVFDWGVSVDATTIDVGYHAFSCSKCHNPHASRLPKLMITNCLDVKQNTWDDANPSQTTFTNTGRTDLGKKTASYDSAQNCHRLNVKFSIANATNISFSVTNNRITSVTSVFTNANGYRLGDRIKITGGVNDGKVGTISAMNGTTTLDLSNVTDATGASTTITTATAGPQISLEGFRGGWNKITPW